MKSFRRPQYLERYEDVVFETEQPLAVNPNDGAKQERTGIKLLQIIVEKELHLIGTMRDFLLISKLIN